MSRPLFTLSFGTAHHSIGDTHTIENSGERMCFGARIVARVELWASRCRVVRATRDVVVATSLGYVRGRGGSHSPPVREGGDVFCFLVWCPVGVAPSRYGFVDEVLIEMSDARLITYARCMCSYVAPAS